MKETPSVRKDGRCVVCRKPRKMPDPPQKGVSAAQYTLDPFCSAECSKQYFGVPTKSTPSSS